MFWVATMKGQGLSGRTGIKGATQRGVGDEILKSWVPSSEMLGLSEGAMTGLTCLA